MSETNATSRRRPDPSRIVKVRSNTPLIALKTFEAAARRQSFAAAAEELFVTPAAVSHQVKRLEDHLEVQLFLRHNRSVVLTEAGRALAEKLHTVFSLLEDALQQMVDVSHEVVRISALPSFAAKWLAPRLHRFEADHPQIRIRIEANDRLANFINDEIDLAIRYGAGDYANSSAERLLDAPAFPVCSPALVQGGRGRRGNDGRVHDRAARDREAIGFEVLPGRREDILAQVVALEQMPELAECCLVRHRLAAQVDPDKTSHRLRVVQRLFHRRV